MKAKTIPGFSRYEALPSGVIRNRRSGRAMRQHTTHKGYRRTGVADDSGVFRTRFVHRLVWAAFNGPVPDGLNVHHINGKRDDNRLDNLRLATPVENAKHRWSNKTRRLRNRKRRLRNAGQHYKIKARLQCK